MMIWDPRSRQEIQHSGNVSLQMATKERRPGETTEGTEVQKLPSVEPVRETHPEQGTSKTLRNRHRGVRAGYSERRVALENKIRQDEYLLDFATSRTVLAKRGHWFPCQEQVA